MKNPVRITIALDEETAALFDKIREELRLSQSELMRRALKFYNDNRGLHASAPEGRILTYIDMLPGGEHVILDVDHWLMFLKLLETSQDKEKFWEEHRRVARSHAEQFSRKIVSPEVLLSRLEACNFFNVKKNAENDFTLVLSSELTKKFITIFLEEVLAGMGYKAEVKEDLAKLRIKVSRLK
jgi:hypothetical protein